MTDNVCGATKRDGSGDECQLPAGWGTDKTEGACKYHGGSGGAPEGNTNAVTVEAWAEDFYDGFLTEAEQERVEKSAEILGENAGAQEIARHAASVCLEQFRRTGDERFIRRYESICDKAGIFPEDELAVDLEQSGDLDVTITREVVDADE
jgi:fermentation-respiration switch protein FrsA (DUF1100 family)